MVRRNQNKVIVDILANAEGAQNDVNNFRGGILSSLGSIGSAVTGIQSLFSMAGGAVSALKKPLMEASEANLSLLNTVNDFQKLSGLTYPESKGYIADLKAEMGELASSLPGVTEDFIGVAVSIQDNLVPVIEELDGSFTTEGLKKYTKELSQNFGMIAGLSGVSGAEIGLGLNRALTENTSIAQLRTLSAFQKNPALIAEIENTAKAIGVEFDNATVAQRVQILTEASRFSEEAVADAKADITTIIGDLQGRLFGMSQGLFSFGRDIGGTTTIQEIGKLAFEFIQGIDEIFSEFGGALDPMKAIHGLVKNFRENHLQSFLDMISRLVEAFNLGGASGVTNEIFSIIADFDFSSIGYTLGTMVGDLVNFIVDFIRNIDRGQLVQAALSIAEGLGVAILAAVTTIDWLGMVATAFTSVAKSYYAAVTLITDMIVMGFTGLGQLAINIIQGIFSTAQGGVNRAINIIRQAINRIIELFQNIGQTIGNAVGQIRNRVDGIRNLASMIPGVNGRSASIVPNGFRGFFPGPMGQAIEREIRAVPSFSPVIANTSEAILNRDQQRALLNRLSNGGGSGGHTINNNFEIHGSNPQEIARQIDMRIKQTFSNRARLA